MPVAPKETRQLKSAEKNLNQRLAGYKKTVMGMDSAYLDYERQMMQQRYYQDFYDPDLVRYRQEERTKQETLLRKKKTNMVDEMMLQLIGVEKALDSAERLALSIWHRAVQKETGYSQVDINF